jgi:uncharacterized protein YjbI with pentapeptide repeats
VGAKLAGADLRDAQMGPLMIAADRLLSCNLAGASLKVADLARADLRGAILTGADISRANFTNAVTKGAELTDAIRDGVRGLSGI